MVGGYGWVSGIDSTPEGEWRTEEEEYFIHRTVLPLLSPKRKVVVISLGVRVNILKNNKKGVCWVGPSLPWDPLHLNHLNRTRTPGNNPVANHDDRAVDHLARGRAGMEKEEEGPKEVPVLISKALKAMEEV